MIGIGVHLSARPLLSLAIGLALVTCGGTLAASQAPATRTAPAPSQASLTGVVRAHDQTVVQTETAGIVDRILVKEGASVAEGDTIVELRRQRQEIALAVATAAFERATAAVAETRVLLESARKENERAEAAADALSRKDVEDARAALARFEASLRVQSAELERVSQEVKLREHDLRETRLVAPFAGTVTRIFVHRGDTLKPGETPVAEVVNLERLYVEVLLPRQEAQRLSVGRKVQVLVEREWLGAPGRVTGEVSYVNPTVDASSRTVAVKIDIANPSGAVRPGMLAEVRLR
jgi:RND family efflux transporter MFP subunit